MKRFDRLDLLPEGQDMVAGIDMTGGFYRLFQTSAPFPGCAFLLCLRGSCRVKIHLTCYDLKEGSLAIIFPGVFFQIQEQSKDCRFIFVGFSKKLIEGAKLFSYTVEYTPYIFERPVIEMKKDVYELFRDSIRLLIRRQKIKEEMSGMQISLIYTQLLLSLGSVYKKRGEEEDSPRYNRNQEIVKELVRIIVQYYKTERNVSFYAEKLHLSPQHLSTTVKKVTGKTLTDILSSFIIRDAQAKLDGTGNSLFVEFFGYFLLWEILQTLYGHVAQAVSEHVKTIRGRCICLRLPLLFLKIIFYSNIGVIYCVSRYPPPTSQM